MIPISTILIVLMILLMLGALPTWVHSRKWGYGPTSGLGLIFDDSGHPVPRRTHLIRIDQSAVHVNADQPSETWNGDRYACETAIARTENSQSSL